MVNNWVTLRVYQGVTTLQTMKETIDVTTCNTVEWTYTVTADGDFYSDECPYCGNKSFKVTVEKSGINEVNSIDKVSKIRCLPCQKNLVDN